MQETVQKHRFKNILHYPRLDTVLMVEDFIREHSGDLKKRHIWERLPRKVMYQTYCVVFDYLLASNKIAADSEGHIVWVWDPKGAAHYLARPQLRAKPSSGR